MNRITNRKRWEVIRDLIGDEYEQLNSEAVIKVLLEKIPQRDFASPQDAKKYLIEQEQRLLGPLDLACQQFAKHRTLPNLSGEEVLLFFYRLREAVDLIETFLLSSNVIADPPPEMASDAQCVEFLLVDYWNHIGRKRYLYGQIRGL